MSVKCMTQCYLVTIVTAAIKLLGSLHKYQMPQRTRVQPHESICTAPEVSYFILIGTELTHCIEHSSWFVYPESLDHLEHIHHSLCLTAINGGSYGTEHPTATHCVTKSNEN